MGKTPEQNLIPENTAMRDARGNILKIGDTIRMSEFGRLYFSGPSLKEQEGKIVPLAKDADEFWILYRAIVVGYTNNKILIRQTEPLKSSKTAEVKSDWIIKHLS